MQLSLPLKLHWFKLWSFLTLLLGCLGGCGEFGSTEVTDRSYAQYRADNKELLEWFDPKGASAISHRSSATRDGYDEWWSFSIAEADFRSLVTRTSIDNNGPRGVEMGSSASPPSAWLADANVPTWWIIVGGSKPLSFNWCYAAGKAERHHGWFFIYNPELGKAWCWHWNHQWSSSECAST